MEVEIDSTALLENRLSSYLRAEIVNVWTARNLKQMNRVNLYTEEYLLEDIQEEDMVCFADLHSVTIESATS